MLKKIQKRLVLKFLVALLLIIFTIGSLSIIYLYHSTEETWNHFLQNQIENTVNFVRMGYSEPIWNMNMEAVYKVNKAILKDDFFVAVNVYTLDNFWTGHTDVPDNGASAQKISAPFAAEDVGEPLTRIEQVIEFDGEPVGEVELFYSRKAVDSAILMSNIKMALSFIFIAIILVLFILFFFKMLIVKPIFSLQQRLSRVATGNFDQQLQIESEDEIGMLCSSFNQMLSDLRKAYQKLEKSENKFRFLFEQLQLAIDNKDYSWRISKDSGDDDLTQSVNKVLGTLDESDRENKKQTWLKTGQTEFNNQITGKKDITELAQSALNFLCKYLNAQVGAIYIADHNEEDNHLYLQAGYAFEEHEHVNNKVKPGEGLVGQAALEQERILFSDIPEDYIKIHSGLGKTLPQNLLLQSLVHENKVMGVFELGSIRRFSQDHLDLIDSIVTNLAISIQSMLYNQSLQKLLETTRSQSEELRKHQTQLEEANEELEEQTQQLKNSEDRLKEQREELQASNEELEEKTQELEEKNQELKEKNQALDERRQEIEKQSAELKQKQRETEERAKQLQKATKYKSEFLANMSHELRSPLNSMLLLSGLLAEDEDRNLSADQVESARSIYRSGQNLLNLINDILDLAKIESKKMQLNPGKVDLNSLAENIRSEFKPVAKDKKLEFDVHIKDELPRYLYTDQVRLEQIIRNLVSNALKFTKKGYVKITIYRPRAEEILSPDLDPGQSIAISVADTGTGIPKDKQKDVFEAFQQADGSISRSHGGTGLGLSICHELSRLIQGEIRLWSTPGQGSTFVVYIPEALNLEDNEQEGPFVDDSLSSMPSQVLQNEDAGKAESEAKAGSTDQENKLKNGLKQKELLIIEDDLEFAEIVGQSSRMKGFDYHVCSEGKEGIKYALNNKPAAIILDLGLPDIDGWNVMQELKNNSETRHIPVHIISAADKTQEGLQNGALGYLTKPVHKEELDQVFQSIEALLNSTLKELLIVEDEVELQKSIQKLLEKKEINITTREKGLPAYELLKTQKFDCIILDLGLPDISGFELLDRISADETIPKIPVIVYTGRDLSKEETEKLKSYAASIVLKSAVSTDRLLDETTLFLHQVEAELPEEQQQMIRNLHDSKSVLQGKTVLVVDDDMRNAFAVSKFLRSKGMQALIARNGKKALEMLEEKDHIDIVLMDIMMPEMDGYEAMKQIRGKKRFKDLPILALTAKAMKTDKEEAIASGANDYLSKPVDVAKLLGMLRVWLY